jgi:hypothetical protein
MLTHYVVSQPKVVLLENVIPKCTGMSQRVFDATMNFKREGESNQAVNTKCVLLEQRKIHYTPASRRRGTI